ncbi:PASTA domain-containing protein [Micromonospora siamensis]|uniref:PASTA domain-containing protein n=1 Tax=Micromonospora siamensis TaxID=299152 RepID=A0A1C5GX60_9ACTN|nr:PASTA domain-containing protein [Micromonospora siamensis]SCG38187.1 PASTA domain-containing protein [Micromonospora siamensis]
MSDRHEEPPAGDADRTRPMPRGEDQPADAAPQADSPDATRALPRDHGAASGPEPLDRTRQFPSVTGRATSGATAQGSGATARQEPVPGGPGTPPDATAPLPPEPAVWAGRAEVPVARPAEPTAPEWYAAEPAGRRWWAPILLGIVALLLLALIGAGVWLLLRAEDERTGPDRSPTPLPTSAPRTTGAPATTAPTTRPASTPPRSATSSAAERVAVPPLVGLPRDTAEELLDDVGLKPRVRTRESDRPAGTVIASDPDVGELVPAGSEVTLVVAEAPESSGPPTSGRSSAPATGRSSVPPSPEVTATR